MATTPIAASARARLLDEEPTTDLILTILMLEELAGDQTCPRRVPFDDVTEPQEWVTP